MHAVKGFNLGSTMEERWQPCLPRPEQLPPPLQNKKHRQHSAGGWRSWCFFKSATQQLMTFGSIFVAMPRCGGGGGGGAALLLPKRERSIGHTRDSQVQKPVTKLVYYVLQRRAER